MNVTVNSENVEIFQGATVADALRAWSPEAFRDVKKGARRVTDKRGREVLLDGELAEGQALTVAGVQE
jgi:hypothetical protein